MNISICYKLYSFYCFLYQFLNSNLLPVLSVIVSKYRFFFFFWSSRASWSSWRSLILCLFLEFKMPGLPTSVWSRTHTLRKALEEVRWQISQQAEEEPPKGCNITLIPTGFRWVKHSPVFCQYLSVVPKNVLEKNKLENFYRVSFFVRLTLFAGSHPSLTTTIHISPCNDWVDTKKNQIESLSPISQMILHISFLPVKILEIFIKSKILTIIPIHRVSQLCVLLFIWLYGKRLRQLPFLCTEESKL